MSLEQSLKPFPLSAQDYAARFPEIRVQLDWARFGAESWPVNHGVVEDAAELGSLRSAFWVRFRRLNPRFLKTIGTRSLSIAEVAARIAQFPEPGRGHIVNLVQCYRAEGRAEVDAPAYRLADGTFLILDANHRSTALALAGVPFRLHLYVIMGPADHAFRGMKFPAI